ncbi:hypothetical protein [Acrocarpospora sp. B8E8]|uniref:hypothetical protein n=1 Tax=Acrocarpospora sp. B8E8 TaxID=3153572 RepID=UPI00325E2177
MTSPLRTPFTAESTADEIVAGIDLTGRRAVVTGASSGIGVETARALAGAGAEVTLAFVVEAAKRWAADGITANALMPGGVRTNLQRHQSRAEMDKIYAEFGGVDAIRWKSAEQGCSDIGPARWLAAARRNQRTVF